MSTHDYAEAVVAGELVAGPHVRAACERHIRDLERKDLVFDEEKAERAIGFFPDVLRLSAGEYEGVPFDLLLWQAFCVGSLFGWHTHDGRRRFRRGYLEIAKGSGKSPLAGGIGLLMTFADGEPRAES